MNNCLICKHAAYDPVEDKYYCWYRFMHIDILLNSEECHAYDSYYERSEECE